MLWTPAGRNSAPTPSTSAIANLETGNKNYAATFTSGHLALPPSQKYAVLTCMDARIDPSAAFGIPLGAAHVIRNAGASASDAFRSLIISQQLLGTTEVLVVKHTGCGMLTFSEGDVGGIVRKAKGVQAAEEVEGVRWGCFSSLEEEVKSDVEWLRQKKVMEGVRVSGWVYEVETGRVRRVGA